MQIFLIFLGIVLVIAAFTICLVIVSRLVIATQKSASDTVVQTVSDAMKQIFGGDEPATQLPGNAELADEEPPYFPDIEHDDLFFPGSVEEIEGMEAGWAPSPMTDPTQQQPPQN